MKQTELLPGQRPTGYGRKAEHFEQSMHDYAMERVAKTGYDIQLRDNTSGGSRGWNESLLFVPGAPNVVRPFDHTGVEYKLEGRHIEVKLSDPVQHPDRESDVLELRTDHKLCLACTDVFNYYCKYAETRSKSTESNNDGGPTSLANNVVHHHNLWSLCAFANFEQCFLCTKLWNKVSETYPDLAPPQWKTYQIECCWPKKVEGDGEQRMWFVMVNVSASKYPIWNYKHMMRLALWPKATHSQYFDEERTLCGVGVNELVPAFNKEETNDNLASHAVTSAWLTRCNANTDGKHDICNNQPDRNYLPARLLDVQHAKASSRLRLVCTDEPKNIVQPDSKYATLSHCWGAWGAKENPVLLSANLDDRQRVGLSYNHLPKTFRDALDITSRLQVHWLWVDCLCIIQNSKTDWLKEASSMDKTYQNAELNISADFGLDSRAGCFAERIVDEITPLELSSTSAGTTWQITLDDTFKWMESAPSLSRAWITRERQLARRILHCTEKEFVWECSGQDTSSFASETMPGGAPFKRLFNDDRKFQIARTATGELSRETDGLNHDNEQLYKLWYKICESLSRKSVTYATDMPIILSSLAKEFHRMIPDDEYVGGLWRSTLPGSLAWHIPGLKAKDTPFIAPSWSWLSVATEIKPAILSHFLNKLPVTDVNEIDADLKYDDTYGPLSHGALHMDGFLRSIQIRSEDENPLILSVYDELGHSPVDTTLYLRTIGPDFDEEDGDMFVLKMDEAIQLEYGDPTFTCFAFFTTIGEWAQNLDSNRRELTAILLEPVEGGGNTYRRIGVLDHICDLYALKMRYAVATEQVGDPNSIQEAQTPLSVRTRDTLYISEPAVFDHDATSIASLSTDPIDTAAQVSVSAEEQHPRDVTTGADPGSLQSQADVPTTSARSSPDLTAEAWVAITEYIKHTRWTIINIHKKREHKAERPAKRVLDGLGDYSSDESESTTGAEEEEEGSAAGANDEEADGSEPAGDGDNGEEEAADANTDPVTGAGTDAENANNNDDAEETANDDITEEQEDDESSSYYSDSSDDHPGISHYTLYTGWRDRPDGRGPFADAIANLRAAAGMTLEDEEAETLEIWKVVLITSKTVAYGTSLPPQEAMYQFDDTLDRQPNEQGLFPQLTRLRTSKIVLV